MITQRQIRFVPALVQQLRIARAELQRNRDSAHENAVNLSTGLIDDAEDRAWVAEMDARLAGIDGVLKEFP